MGADLIFRAATSEDTELLWRWRNDEETRKQSLSSDEVSLDDHKKWFAKALQNPNRKLFIVEIGKKPVATVRADSDGQVTELSWTVAPDARGKGLGSVVLSQFSEMISGKQVAKIKHDNIPSKKMAEKAGFTFSRREPNFDVWHKNFEHA